MPRKPIHVGSQIPDRNDGARKGEVICRNCDYRWYPDPRLWRNFSMSNGEKVLCCPMCAVKNSIDKAKLHEIVNRTEVIMEMRKLGRP